ncbi:putative phosphatidylglycerol specific phospholipase C [Talaromyces proteolyticus]|uniref:Phosphatidylglycerol specific phospholipase C n=1 Tax=Talaromyces proteolyticus TaxID=1131652 RepID=A0AAD4PSV0_9EURO|nr:putative phosphatidylglycerol specific phospholipase C [Talaromyces proteolyticus]KAH8692096.1 putative phosphatidylglycerol specific phospholipase C [Talaromyces proteolyticus]
MKSNIAAAAVVGLLASSTVASPANTHSNWDASADNSINKNVDAPFGYKAGSKQSIANLKSKIKNVVWILLENRSFDNILGGIERRGLDNPVNNGDYCIPQNLSQPNGKQWCTGAKDFDSIQNDPDHSVTGNNLEFFGQFSPNNADVASGKIQQTNRGFVNKQLISYPSISAETAAKQVLNYYTEDQVPVMVDLVDEFTTFNYWFSCVPGPTNPNRLCAVAGTSDGHGKNDNDFDVSAIDIPSIFEVASGKNISWLNYDGTNGAFLPDSLFFNWTAKHAPNSVVPIENFFQDAYLGQLPQLSYLNPSCCGANTNSMHPNGNVSYGEIFVKQIYEALRNGPQWEESLLLLTYDETGGFFDHVPSPAAVRPDNKTYTETAHDGSSYTLLFDRLGGRMPTFLISPYTPAGHIENYGTNPATGKPEAYSATSVLKTLGYLWDLEDSTPRVSNSPSFDHLIGPNVRRKANQLAVPKTF